MWRKIAQTQSSRSSLLRGYASVPLARKLERYPIGGGDGKAGIGNGSSDIEEKGSSGGREDGEAAWDDEFDGDADRRDSRGEGRSS